MIRDWAWRAKPEVQQPLSPSAERQKESPRRPRGAVPALQRLAIGAANRIGPRGAEAVARHCPALQAAKQNAAHASHVEQAVLLGR